MDLQRLIETLLYALSRPPASSGKRLRSERELATLFSVGEAQVRKALSRLVDEGILVRRRGSGTFVRRVADAGEMRHTDLPAEMLKKASLVFTDSKLPQAGVANMQSAQLHIGLWGDLGNNSLIDQFIIGSVAKATSLAGHRLTVHNTIQDFQTWDTISVDAFRQQLENHPCDGYLVVNSIADLFVEALGETQVPVVFFLGGTLDIKHEPVVMLDTAESLRRSVTRFYEMGYTRIGFIGEKRKDEDPNLIDLEVRAYEESMSRLGLTYSAYGLTSTGVGQAMAVTRQLLRRSDPPEALYVADDYVLVGVAEALALEGVEPGKDIGIITLGNRNFPLPPGRIWSRMEFDRERFAQLLVDNLLYQLQSPGAKSNTIALHASWVAGDTHTVHKRKVPTAISALAAERSQSKAAETAT